MAILASYVLPASKITTDLIHLYLTKVKNAFNVKFIFFPLWKMGPDQISLYVTPCLDD